MSVDLAVKEAGRTAITRNAPSRPLRDLLEMNRIKGKVLDYGSGKGADVRFLREIGFDVTGYDPVHGPATDPKGGYNTILCTYVLNALPKKYEEIIVRDLLWRLEYCGEAFVTVRTDITTDGPTSRGYQRFVELDEPIIRRVSGGVIYRLGNDDNWARKG